MNSPEDLVKLGKALANPIRVKILLLLVKNPTFIQDVAQRLKIPYALAHMHLRVLEEAGLVEGIYQVVETPRPHLRKIYRARDFKIVIDKELLEKLAERL